MRSEDNDCLQVRKNGANPKYLQGQKRRKRKRTMEKLRNREQTLKEKKSGRRKGRKEKRNAEKNILRRGGKSYKYQTGTKEEKQEYLRNKLKKTDIPILERQK